MMVAIHFKIIFIYIYTSEWEQLESESMLASISLFHLR